MLKPYESIKFVNTNWIKTIPTHWEIERIGVLFFERKEKVSDKDFPPLSVTQNGILPQLASAAKSDDGDNRKLVLQNDFVINSRSDRKGSSGISNLTGSVSLINIVLEPRIENNGKYLHYLLKSNGFIEEYYRNGRGIVADLWTTRFSEMKTILLPVPPKKEQDQIVRFLDWKLVKINKLIKAKTQQIILLNEQKQAIINKAVTKGLDDTVPMKDSGVEWLEKIPITWKIDRLKRFCEVNASISHLTSEYSDGDKIVFLPMENVTTEGVINCIEKRSLASVRSGYSSFAKNDVVVAKITPCFENGKGACLDQLETDIGYGTTEFITLRSYSTILPKFLYYITKLSWFRLFGSEVMTGSAGQKRIPSDFISNFVLGIPNLEEQKKIINYIEKNILTLNIVISKVKNEIILLNEYKTSLIASVVTGKIDVRNIKVPNMNVDFKKSQEYSDNETDDLELIDELEDGFNGL